MPAPTSASAVVVATRAAMPTPSTAMQRKAIRLSVKTVLAVPLV